MPRSSNSGKNKHAATPHPVQGRRMLGPFLDNVADALRFLDLVYAGVMPLSFAIFPPTFVGSPVLCS